MRPMRTLVIGDVHGKLSLLNRLLEESQYQAGADRLVFIGDLVDRGEDSRGVVERVLALRRESPEKVIVIKGNHEEMMLSALARPDSDASDMWYANGGIETLQSYANEDGTISVPPEHLEFIASLPTWFEDAHAIYVHASLPKMIDGSFLHPSMSPDSTELLWARNRRFFDGYDGKLVVFGHTITGTIFGERGKVWQRDSLIDVDTGAYLTGVLSAVELPSRQVYSVSEPGKEIAEAEEAGATTSGARRRRFFGLW
jgi:serine/threonine protein phosphatase 1